MFTEREVVLQIAHGDPRGLPGLTERHGALLREASLRFFGAAGEEQSVELQHVLRTLVAELRAGAFDDLAETFYDWVARRTFCACMVLRQERAGGEHLEPDLLHACSDAILEASLPAETRSRCRAHLAECALCRELRQSCTDVPVAVRHAGARFPGEFQLVLQRAAAGCT